MTASCLHYWSTGLTERERETERQRERQREGERGRDRQTDRQTDRPMQYYASTEMYAN